MNESPNFNLYLLSCQTAKLLNFRKRNHTAFVPALTMADRLSRVAEQHPLFGLFACGRGSTLSCKLAFTMAEILISLTIIGIIAAITLPALQANINESAWRAQRKALYSRMSQAISMMSSLNGYGVVMGENGIDETQTKQKAAQTFITDGLSKVLKINNICDNTHFKDCGIASYYKDIAGARRTTQITLHQLNAQFSLAAHCDASYSAQNTNAVAFETQNGESIIAYYNPNCLSEYVDSGVTSDGIPFGFYMTNMCVNFVYDLNGLKGPNQVGRDIGFITAFNNIDSIVVAPILPKNNERKSSTALTWSNALKFCHDKSSDYRLPNIDELSAMAVNRILLNFYITEPFWSGSVVDSDKAWFLNPWGHRVIWNKNGGAYARCIKR